MTDYKVTIPLRVVICKSTFTAFKGADNEQIIDNVIQALQRDFDELRFNVTIDRPSFKSPSPEGHTTQPVTVQPDPDADKTLATDMAFANDKPVLSFALQMTAHKIDATDTQEAYDEAVDITTYIIATFGMRKHYEVWASASTGSRYLDLSPHWFRASRR